MIRASEEWRPLKPGSEKNKAQKTPSVCRYDINIKSYICVYMYIHIHICILTSIHIYIFTCIHIDLCIHIYVHTYIHIICVCVDRPLYEDPSARVLTVDMRPE